MSDSENKFNRSHSESELYNGCFDYSRHFPDFNQDFFDSSTSQKVQSFVGPYQKIPPVKIRRAVYVEEICDDYFPRTLVQTYTTKQIIGRSDSDLCNLENTFNKCVVSNNTFAKVEVNVTHFKPFLQKESTNCYSDIGVIPMDVDDYYNNDDYYNDEKTAEAPGIYTERNIQDDQQLKQRKMPSKQTKITDSDDSFLQTSSFIENKTILAHLFKHKNKSQKSALILVFILFVVFAVILYVCFFKGDCLLYANSDIQVKNLQEELIENVHEQKNSIDVIVRTLKQRDRWASKVKILGFIGSTGVGKTFIANIIKRHFHSSVIHDIYGNHLTYKQQWEKIAKSLQSSCLNLIVIDDLKKTDTIDLFDFTQNLPTDRFTLVLAIFNIQYSDERLNYNIKYEDIKGIRDDFDQSDLHHELIIFREFDMHHVSDWLEKKLSLEHVECRDKDKLLKNILENHDPKHQGLKGLQSKLVLQMNIT